MRVLLLATLSPVALRFLRSRVLEQRTPPVVHLVELPTDSSSTALGELVGGMSSDAPTESPSTPTITASDANDV